MRARREAHCGTRTRWRACGAPRKRFETFLIDCDGFFFVKLNEEYVFSRRHVRLLAFEEGEAARRERMRDSLSESARAPQRGNKKCVCVSEREREREKVFFPFFPLDLTCSLSFDLTCLLSFDLARSLQQRKKRTGSLSSPSSLFVFVLIISLSSFFRRRFLWLILGGRKNEKEIITNSKTNCSEITSPLSLALSQVVLSLPQVFKMRIRINHEAKLPMDRSVDRKRAKNPHGSSSPVLSSTRTFLPSAPVLCPIRDRTCFSFE